MKIIIVLCYALFQNQENYKKYLDKVLNIIDLENPDKIIVCGGFTNKNFPEISEAKSATDYLLTKNSSLKDKIILEERSITTPQNIKFAIEEISKLNKKVDSVIFVCDSIRLVKVYCIGSLLMSEPLGFRADKEQILLELMRQIENKKIDFAKECQLHFENITFKGVDMKRSILEVGDQIPRSLTEVFALEFPLLEKAALDHRSKEWGLKNDKIK